MKNIVKYTPGVARAAQRDANKKKKTIRIPMPKRWTNLTWPKSTIVYNSQSWKALSRSEQQKFIDDGRPKPHEHLHLCHANYPPELKEAWFALTDNGTFPLSGLF
jgi:hypothetical protein